jgi:cholesterol oxidase
MHATTSAGAALRLALDATTIRYPSPEGALGHTMILLACGHDGAGGRYVPSGDDLYVAWPGVMNEASFRAMREEMQAYATALGGVFIENPRSTRVGGGVLQATHPLGGAPMGETVDDGVVDHAGVVLDPERDRHDGLRVLDAAAIPRSLGAPPLLTLTALAERAMRRWSD